MTRLKDRLTGTEACEGEKANSDVTRDQRVEENEFVSEPRFQRSTMATGSVAQARPAGTRIPVVGSAKPTTLSASSLPVPQTVGSKSKITVGRIICMFVCL